MQSLNISNNDLSEVPNELLAGGVCNVFRINLGILSLCIRLFKVLAKPMPRLRCAAPLPAGGRVRWADRQLPAAPPRPPRRLPPRGQPGAAGRRLRAPHLGQPPGECRVPKSVYWLQLRCAEHEAHRGPDQPAAGLHLQRGHQPRVPQPLQQQHGAGQP